MTKTSSQLAKEWIGVGSISSFPPADYWTSISDKIPRKQIDELQQKINSRQTEFTPSTLPLSLATATELLELVASDRWLRKIHRFRCPKCDFELDQQGVVLGACPECSEAYSQHGGVITETIYLRTPLPRRTVDWMIAIHGMNTTGAWQESFSWYLSTTWGRSVPVAVYKYGYIVAGVIMAWRRSKLRDNLREKLATLRDEAHAQGFPGKPDVIAHSFGTWLFGHVLETELKRPPEDRLCFGRIILTGCILRPDFDWKRIKQAGLVDEILNHYGSNDCIVPLAHATIYDSGPSGRRGFDDDEVLNIRAEGYGHSDLFSVKKCLVDEKVLQHCSGDSNEVTQLEHSYKKIWRPFLTLPSAELFEIPDRNDPSDKWRALPWLLRGTIFPFTIISLMLALTVLIVTGISSCLFKALNLTLTIAILSAVGLVAIMAAIGLTLIWRKVG
jgi:hypothetical protein